MAALDRAIGAMNDALRGLADEDPDLRRTWHLVAVMTAVARGMLADGIVTDRRGLRALNDEDFLDWIGRHGAPPEVADFAFIRGLYDLGFAEAGAARSRRGVSAGVAVFLTTKMFLEYRGAIFWKMAAGMGDIVFAPLLRGAQRAGRRLRVLPPRRSPPPVGRSHEDRDGDGRPSGRVWRRGASATSRWSRFGGLPCFPSAPLLDQLDAGPEIEGQPLESHFCEWPDAETRVLRDGVDYDVLVFAISLGMVPYLCRELIEDRREWRAMVENVKTTATQALQVWLRGGRAGARLAPSRRDRQRV